jgi:AcrR family transcriptional regulator
VSDPVKPRRYDNSRRTETAQQTRRSIVAAARELFVEVGYPGATLVAVAGRAGVSVQSLYAHFGSKRALLKAVVDQAVAGDDQPVAVRDRDWVHEIQAEPDPRVKLRLHAAAVRRIQGRAAPVDRMLRSASLVDGDAAAQRERGAAQRLAGMREFADLLFSSGHLRSGLTAAAAAERMAVLIDPELYQLCVDGRGWSADAYEEWLGELLIASLLPAAGS